MAYSIHSCVVGTSLLWGIRTPVNILAWTWTVPVSTSTWFSGIRVTSVSLWFSRMRMVPVSTWFLWTGTISTWTWAGLTGFPFTPISHTTVSHFSVISVSSLVPISCLQFQISHKSVQLLYFLISFLKLSMPQGAWYRSVCLIWPLSKARLFLLLLMLPIFESFLSSFLPYGSLRRPDESALGMAYRTSFRDFSMCESLLNHGFVADSHRQRQLWAPKMVLMGLTSIGLATFL